MSTIGNEAGSARGKGDPAEAYLVNYCFLSHCHLDCQAGSLEVCGGSGYLKSSTSSIKVEAVQEDSDDGVLSRGERGNYVCVNSGTVLTFVAGHEVG